MRGRTHTILGLLALWGLVVFAILRAELWSAPFVAAILGSVRRMVIGYVLVAGLGVTAGLALAGLGRVRLVEQLVGSVAVALNAIPGAAWVPLAILLFGVTEQAVIFTIVLGATGILVVNTDAGIREVPPLIQRAARTIGARGTGYFWFVAVPAAVPKIVDGLRLAWAFGWRALMAGELFTSVAGLGRILSDAANTQRLDQLLALMLLIAAIGVVVDGLIKIVQQEVRVRWGLA